jgi:hypothetical protein
MPGHYLGWPYRAGTRIRLGQRRAVRSWLWGAMMMSKIAKVVVAVVLGGATASANAWWGGPFSEWVNDFFGDAGFNFNFGFSMHGSGHGWGRGYDYYGPYGDPYWSAYRPLAYSPPGPMLSEEQREARERQQNQTLQEAVEAQRRFAEQALRQPPPRPPVTMGVTPLAEGLSVGLPRVAPQGPGVGSRAWTRSRQGVAGEHSDADLARAGTEPSAGSALSQGHKGPGGPLPHPPVPTQPAGDLKSI